MSEAEQTDPFLRFKETPVKCEPFDPRALELYEIYRARVRDWLGPDAYIELRGSTALGLPGKGELDISVIAADVAEFRRIREKLLAVFGTAGSDEPEFVRFDDALEGREIELMIKLAGSEGERLEQGVLERLRSDPRARERYVELKQRYAYSKREYYRQKERFFGELLAESVSGQKS
jgi:GrpB-like predicted nucleotidyltransferase (UPF0157 family)